MKIIPTLLLSFLVFSLSLARANDAILKIGSKTIHAEIADTEESRERGLMQRDHLCENCGMLFIFEQADRYQFWMKNTTIPLSIAFISTDGSIINIDEMLPNTTNIHDAQGKALYALEMKSGWFSKNHISAADKVLGLKPVNTSVH